MLETPIYTGEKLRDIISAEEALPSGYVIIDTVPVSTLLEPTTRGSKYDQYIATYPNVVFVERRDTDHSLDVALPVDDTREVTGNDNPYTTQIAVGRIAVKELDTSPYQVEVHIIGNNNA